MKTNNIKRIIAIYLAVVFVLSAIAIVGVSAKTYTTNHTVELASIAGDTYGIGASMGGKGRMSDTFQANPTIFDGYSSSNNRVEVYNSEGQLVTTTDLVLYANSGAPKTVIYDDDFEKGSYNIKYIHESDGGFRASSVFTRTY